MKKAVLLIDDDLCFAFWLGRVLDRAGYIAFPAKSVSDALTLIAELHLSVGMVMVKYSLPGMADFIARMRDAESQLKVILLVEDVKEPAYANADAQCVRPRNVSGSSGKQWLQVVERVLV